MRRKSKGRERDGERDIQPGGELMKETVRQVARTLALVAILGGGLSGCDWWPPALQEKIGQQDAQLKVFEAEKGTAQKRVAELTKALEEAKAKAAQADQAATALRAENDQLKATLAEAEAKSKKPAKPVPSKKK
jgi:septal ring factor EnvC (AmiA/AmiB activator)